MESSQGGYNLFWGILLLVRGNWQLANAPTNLCYQHIDAAYDCSMYYQLSNLFCLCPAQQHPVPVQQGYIKLQPTMENITHPLMDITIKILRLETSKRGGPVLLPISVQHEVSRETSKPIFPRIGPPISRGEC